MDAIVSFLQWVGETIVSWFKVIITETVKFGMTIWGIIVIVAALAYFAFADTVGAIQQIGSGVGMLSTSVSGGVSAAGSTGMSFLLAVANTFTPLTELFQYVSAYLVLMGGFGVYRLVKSWIPGLFPGGGGGGAG